MKWPQDLKVWGLETEMIRWLVESAMPSLRKAYSKMTAAMDIHTRLKVRGLETEMIRWLVESAMPSLPEAYSKVIAAMDIHTRLKVYGLKIEPRKWLIFSSKVQHIILIISHCLWTTYPHTLTGLPVLHYNQPIGLNIPLFKVLFMSLAPHVDVQMLVPNSVFPPHASGVVDGLISHVRGIDDNLIILRGRSLDS